MSEKVFEIETSARSTSSLCVRVCYQQDRFVTQLDGLFGSETVPLLRSVEGTSSDVWPASGPLQEVLPQANESGELLTAVGRAGKSHWSTVVSCTEDGGIEFDFACRVKAEPSWLGSTYETLSRQLISTDPARWEIEIPDRAAKLVCEAATTTRLDVEGRFVRFSPVAKQGEVPRTDRWKYVFRLVPLGSLDGHHARC